MLLHAHFVLIRCVLNHLGVGREGMKRRQDCQDGDSGANPLGQRDAMLDGFPGEFRPVCARPAAGSRRPHQKAAIHQAFPGVALPLVGM
jgi:hypothetical protein